MKFNWGTGIFIFLVIFVITAVSFVIFTLQFDANLVYEDYYEKGVDHTEQMRLENRSRTYSDAFSASSENGAILVSIEENLSSRIDSGNIHVYRPSDRRRDLNVPLTSHQKNLTIPEDKLISGRYILLIAWYSEGIKYEVKKPVHVQ